MDIKKYLTGGCVTFGNSCGMDIINLNIPSLYSPLRTNITPNHAKDDSADGIRYSPGIDSLCSILLRKNNRNKTKS